ACIDKLDLAPVGPLLVLLGEAIGTTVADHRFVDVPARARHPRADQGQRAVVLGTAALLTLAAKTGQAHPDMWAHRSASFVVVVVGRPCVGRPSMLRP